MTDPRNPYRNGSDHSPPPFAMTAQDSMLFMLGELKTGLRHLTDDVHETKDEIKTQLRTGHTRMDTIEASIRSLQPRPEPDNIGGWEKAIKRPIPLVILIAVLALTGKLEIVVRFLEAVAKLADVG